MHLHHRPSGSGKSSLAVSLSEKVNIPVVHLDQLAHVPFTKWQRRPDDEFVALHDQALAEPSWVMDGNYSVCMTQRFQRATSVIWLDLSPLGCTARYLWRCLRSQSKRRGGLLGAECEFNFKLMSHIWMNYPKKKPRYRHILRDCNQHPIVLKSTEEVQQLMQRLALKQEL